MTSLDLATVQAQVAQNKHEIYQVPARHRRHPLHGFADRRGRRTHPGGDARAWASTKCGSTAWATPLGRIGAGATILLYDSHIDTVGIGDPAEWEWDPFKGKVENGRFYARGACDEKGSTPGMIYGLALAQRPGPAGRLDRLLLRQHGGVVRRHRPPCAGRARRHPPRLRRHRRADQDAGLPRPQGARRDREWWSRAAAPTPPATTLGDNAIYKVLPIIEAISKLEPALGDHPFLGHGKVTVTDMKVQTPSINAVPDLCTVYIDRRLTFGESGRGRHRAGSGPGAREH